MKLFAPLARRLSGYDDALMEGLSVSAGVHRHADAARFEHMIERRRFEAKVEFNSGRFRPRADMIGEVWEGPDATQRNKGVYSNSYQPIHAEMNTYVRHATGAFFTDSNALHACASKWIGMTTRQHDDHYTTNKNIGTKLLKYMSIIHARNRKGPGVESERCADSCLGYLREALKEGDAHAMRSSTTASKDVVKNRNANGREK